MKDCFIFVISAFCGQYIKNKMTLQLFVCGI